MSIILFALIGAAIEAGVAYWICFSIFCICKTTVFVSKLLKALSD